MIPRRALAVVLILAVGISNGYSRDCLIESIDVSTPLVAPDDGTFWMQARAGVIPIESSENNRSQSTILPRTLITLQKIDRKGTHLYHGIAAMWSNDLGKTWTDPAALAEGSRIPTADGILQAPCDMTTQYHEATRKVLVTGALLQLDLKLKRDIRGGPCSPIYMVFDLQANTWQPWKILELPNPVKFHFAPAGCSQRVDLPNGDVLLPIYFQAKDSQAVRATVARCQFDGTTLRYLEHGNELLVHGPTASRGFGLYEPSLTKFGKQYLLTLRSVDRAYVATSDDGLHFSEPKPWLFDDGTELGSYNTQQHWVTHSEGLFLAYTRRGADNDKVLRHRAPLFMAQVDPEKLVVMRATEQTVLPNLGKPFGNFGVCNVTLSETWVTDCLVNAEPGTPNLYVAKIRWSRPNRLVQQ